MAGGFELLIVVDAKGKTVFKVGFDLIPSGEIQTLESDGSLHTLLQTASCGGTNRQIPTTSGTNFLDFQFFGSPKLFRHVRYASNSDQILRRSELTLCAISDQRTTANSILIRSPRRQVRAASAGFRGRVSW